MKKLTKLMAILMALCLITSSFVGSTLAKYVTAGTANDSARVAKWGVTVTSIDATNSTMFKTEYEADDDTFTLDTNSVISTDGDVVAPGTSGALAEVVVAGTPEVAVRVTYEPVLELTGWTAAGAEYCPIIFTVEGTQYKIEEGTAIEDVATLITEVQNAIKACKKDYKANEAITFTTDAPSVSWEWPFSTSDDNDIKDTALGNAAADDVANAAKINLTIRTVATQID